MSTAPCRLGRDPGSLFRPQRICPSVGLAQDWVLTRTLRLDAADPRIWYLDIEASTRWPRSMSTTSWFSSGQLLSALSPAVSCSLKAGENRPPHRHHSAIAAGGATAGEPSPSRFRTRPPTARSQRQHAAQAAMRFRLGLEHCLAPLGSTADRPKKPQAARMSMS